MKNNIEEYRERPGFYVYPIFPMAASFLATFGVARFVSFLAPDLNLEIAGVHVHHFVWGISVLTVSGYLALVLSGPRAKYLIALLHGFGLGLAFDEFAFWLKLTDDDLARWSYDGFFIIMGAFLLIISAKKGIRVLKSLWPFG